MRRLRGVTISIVLVSACSYGSACAPAPKQASLPSPRISIDDQERLPPAAVFAAPAKSRGPHPVIELAAAEARDEIGRIFAGIPGVSIDFVKDEHSVIVPAPPKHEPWRGRLYVAGGGRVRLELPWVAQTVICDGVNEWTVDEKAKMAAVRPAVESSVCLLAWIFDRSPAVEASARRFTYEYLDLTTSSFRLHTGSGAGLSFRIYQDKPRLYDIGMADAKHSFGLWIHDTRPGITGVAFGYLPPAGFLVAGKAAPPAAAVSSTK